MNNNFLINLINYFYYIIFIFLIKNLNLNNKFLKIKSYQEMRLTKNMSCVKNNIKLCMNIYNK